MIVRQLHDLSGYDIVGLTEVRAGSIKKYIDALSASGNTYLNVNTATGGSDRIVLAYNTKRLQLLRGYEMHRFGDWLQHCRSTMVEQLFRNMQESMWSGWTALTDTAMWNILPGSSRNHMKTA